MLALLVEILGGPEDGRWVEVPWIGAGLIVHRGHRYQWCVEDTGTHYLQYVGEAA